jgi:hypothetical protein
VAEGGGLLNRYTVISRIVGSNPIPSAISKNFRMMPTKPRVASLSNRARVQLRRHRARLEVAACWCSIADNV